MNMHDYLTLPEFVLWWIMQDNCWYYTMINSYGSTVYFCYYLNDGCKEDIFFMIDTK